ncbi:MAG: hypothetical protein RJA57_418 [Bacteroidota bacterium]
MEPDFFEANRHLWNLRTAVHVGSAFYDRAGFLAGAPALTPIELGELGDLSGRSLLHLQCHFGMDTLDWARRGAVVTGVDISDVSIQEAERLRDEMGLKARFIRCNVLDTPAHVPETFDIVFTSYGTIGWLPDLEPWAAVIAQKLKPGGLFFLAEFHPVVWMFDDSFSRIQYPYRKGPVIVTENGGTYTDRDALIAAQEYSWNHGIGEVLSALMGAGLTLRSFREYDHSPYPCFRNTREVAKGHWQVRGLEGLIPMVYTLKAVME